MVFCPHHSPLLESLRTVLPSHAYNYCSFDFGALLQAKLHKHIQSSEMPRNASIFRVINHHNCIPGAKIHPQDRLL